jgi:hypothetical protein
MTSTQTMSLTVRCATRAVETGAIMMARVWNVIARAGHVLGRRLTSVLTVGATLSATSQRIRQAAACVALGITDSRKNVWDVSIQPSPKRARAVRSAPLVVSATGATTATNGSQTGPAHDATMPPAHGTTRYQSAARRDHAQTSPTASPNQNLNPSKFVLLCTS